MAKHRRFRNEAQEQVYWQSHDSAGKVNWGGAVRATMPNLQPSVRTISLRLPESMLDELKVLAHKRDVPYQSLIKVFLFDRIRREIEDEAA